MDEALSTSIDDARRSNAPINFRSLNATSVEARGGYVETIRHFGKLIWMTFMARRLHRNLRGRRG